MSKCKRYIEFRDHFKNIFYEICDKSVKYSCEYKDIRGEIQKECVCGIHFNSLKKWNDKMNKKYNFNPELKYEKTN